MMEALEFYREEFARFQEHRAHEPAWLKTLRQEAFGRFESMGLPTRRTESWKYTSVKPFVATPFRVVPNRAQGTATPVTEDASLVSLQDCHRLVFTNGHFDKGASSLSALPEGVGERW